MALLNIILLTSCTGLPVRLQTAANQSMEYLNAEMSTAIEGFNHYKPILTDRHQLSEVQWCLTYELGPLFSFSSLWQKVEQDWIQTELRPYEGNCNWARR